MYFIENEKSYRAFKKKSKILRGLKASIKGYADESRRIREKEIKPNAGWNRWTAWEHKKELGQTARIMQLAYGLMLGKSYSQIEPSKPLSNRNYGCRAGSDRSYANAIIDICKFYWPSLHYSQNLTTDAVLCWFRTDENVLFVPARSKKVRFRGKDENESEALSAQEGEGYAV